MVQRYPAVWDLRRKDTAEINANIHIFCMVGARPLIRDGLIDPKAVSLW